MTRANRLCTKYCSISKEKFAVKRNGFNLEWSKQIPLLHSPISKSLKTIMKVKKERVPIAVLIAPDQPNQKCFTELKEIAMQVRYLSESTQVLLIGVKHRSKGWAQPPGIIYLFQWEQRRRKLSKQLLQARGLSSNAADRVISNWSIQWRTHISGLALLILYLKRIHQQPDYLLNLVQPQIFKANYLEDAINQKCSDNSVKNQRCALAVLLKFI
ncbi:MAG: hypothetical protein EZS28_008448 [Streblomastix strix]|uniref:Uncharacterized protein n=1 Tax=Streblomastix strix TaxID=222440 RepID=A0A5J4WPA8_9EUKA|nr:MAG: hypothetical protein EZS28_008448 [Streblomastix strix]